MVKSKINLIKIINDVCDPFKDEDGNECYYEWQVKDAMLEFGVELLKLVAENAYCSMEHPDDDNGLEESDYIVNKDSILGTINQVE